MAEYERTITVQLPDETGQLIPTIVDLLEIAHHAALDLAMTPQILDWVVAAQSGEQGIFIDRARYEADHAQNLVALTGINDPEVLLQVALDASEALVTAQGQMADGLYSVYDTYLPGDPRIEEFRPVVNGFDRTRAMNLDHLDALRQVKDALSQGE